MHKEKYIFAQLVELFTKPKIIYFKGQFDTNGQLLIHF